MKINSLLKELNNSLENKFKDNFTGLVLFGSYAKNKQNSSSYIDILLTFKNCLTLETLLNYQLKKLYYVRNYISIMECKWN